jgi:acetoacetyl-CoA synthetase
VLSALSVGCAVVAYDGSPFAPSAATLWALAARHKITILGLSPRYISTLEAQGYLPNKEYDLSHLSQIQTAGSPLEVCLPFRFVLAVRPLIALIFSAGETLRLFVL